MMIMEVLTCCPNFIDCFERYQELAQRSTTSVFDCSNCVSYKCYLLGYENGVTQLKQSVINALK